MSVANPDFTETQGPAGDVDMENKSTVSHETEVVLNAVKSLQISMDKRFDEIQNENKSAIEQLQEKISDVRKEFNNRMDGLTKKVEEKVNKNMKKTVEDKVKCIRKEIDADVSKIAKQVKDAGKVIDRIKETIIPTMQETLGDETDELRSSMNRLRDQVKDRPDSSCSLPQENRHTNIVIRNMVQRENENVERRVNGLIQDSLRLRDISVAKAVRKQSRSDSKPGLIIATMKSNEEKETVMKHKRHLKTVHDTNMCISKMTFQLANGL